MMMFKKFVDNEIKAFFPFGQTHAKPAPTPVEDKNLFYLVINIPGYNRYAKDLDHKQVIMNNILKKDANQLLKENKNIRISSALYKSGTDGLTTKDVFSNNRVSPVGFYLVLAVKAPSITAEQCETEKPYKAKAEVAKENISKLKMSAIVSVHYQKADKEMHSINNSKFKNEEYFQREVEIADVEFTAITSMHH